jgi:leucyl-tRNA synthetase
MMFKAPPEDSLEWSDDGVEGSARFVRRLWRTVYEHVEGRGAWAGNENKSTAASPSLAHAPCPTPLALTDSQRELRRAAHQTLMKVGDDIGRRRVFNTAIAAVMELMNTLAKFDDVTPQGRVIVQEVLEIVVQVLSPIMPHATHAMWSELGHSDALVDRAWPQADPAALVRDEIEIVLQVNGKLRGRISVSAQAVEADIRAAALADVHVQKWIEGKPLRKVIVVPGKLVNVVV